MAKLIVFAAIMVALLAIAQASGSTTPTTVDEAGLDNQQLNQIQEKCSRQIHQHYKQLDRCRQYLEYQRDELFGTPKTQEHLRECCKGLRKLKGDKCRCDFAADELYAARKGKGWGDQELRRLLEAARYLPKNCQVGPKKCSF